MVKLNKEFLQKFKLSNLKKDFIELIKDISLKDIIVFLVFPIFITFLMFLPSIIREFLSFHIYNPKWWQFFTHAFIHKDLGHLWHNLQGYFIFGVILLIFASRIKNKKDLFILFLFTLISLPIISSIIEILIYPIFMPMIKTSQGSSGIVSAILGFLPMLWIYHFSKKQRTNLININFFNISTLYVALLFVIIYYPIHKNILFILLLIGFILFFSFLYRKNFKPILKGVFKESKDNVIFYFLTILLPVFFMIAPLLLFPVKIVQGNSLVDFFMHYIGLLYGIIISFIFLKLKFYHSS
jgi:membrane associated rhomboid family serine protease